MLITAGLSAVMFQLMTGFSSGISWYGAWTLGILVSITDPVEVIARLNHKRASHKFITLVELEALTNDATGILFFTFFTGLALKPEAHPPSLSLNYFTMNIIVAGLGGIALGYVFRLICQQWLWTIYNDNTNIINIMFVFSFLLFTLAESPILKWSGTFALITLGLGLSKSQGTTIDKKTTSAIHGFYNYALYLAETLIFIAVGIFIGYEIEEHWGDIFHYSDLGLLVAFFLFTIIARFIAIGIFYYPLSKMGYGLDWKKYVLLSYGGLRGSHSLILALVVDEG